MKFTSFLAEATGDLVAGSLMEEILKVRRAHLKMLADRLAKIKGVTDVKVTEGYLDDSFKHSALELKFDGIDCIVKLSHSGYSLEVNSKGFVGPKSTTWKSVEKSLVSAVNEA